MKNPTPTTLKLTNVGQLVTYDPDIDKIRVDVKVEILIRDGKIARIGESTGTADEMIDCRGRMVTPGFVDPHTHPVFLRGREEEFRLRCAGAGYREIASRGGGIRAGIEGVRKATEKELVHAVTPRMNRFLRLGTTTIEAKSGYGLNTESELKSLRVLNRLERGNPIDIIPTFLGAHAFPPEYEGNHDAYVDLICGEMIPLVAKQGIARFCDVFCEEGYFTVPQSRRILETAKVYGLIPRLHADEFTDSGAAGLAGEVGAVSADHLMAVSDAGIAALAESGVTAILLPGTTFFLGSDRYAPVDKLVRAGVKIALATDFNPGSCYLQSMPFIISLACLYLGMSVEEAFQAATYQSAVSLGIEKRAGVIKEGLPADLIIWDLEKLIEIPYYVTDLPIYKVMKSGVAVQNILEEW